MTFYYLILAFAAGLCMAQYGFPLLVKFFNRSEHRADLAMRPIMRANDLISQYGNTPRVPRQGGGRHVDTNRTA